MGNVWDDEPTVGNKIILGQAGDEYTGQVKSLGQAYVERFKKDVPTVVFEDGTDEGLVFEAGLTAFKNSLLRLKPKPGEWIHLVRGENKGTYVDAYAERVEAPEGGKPVRKSTPAEKVPEPVNAPPKKAATSEPPF